VGLPSAKMKSKSWLPLAPVPAAAIVCRMRLGSYGMTDRAPAEHAPAEMASQFPVACSGWCPDLSFPLAAQTASGTRSQQAGRSEMGATILTSILALGRPTYRASNSH